MVCAPEGGQVWQLAEEIAASNPFGKDVEVVDCSYSGRHDRPVIVLGNEVPASLSDMPVGNGLVFNDTLQLRGEDFLLVHKRLMLVPGRDTTVASLFLSHDATSLVNHLREEIRRGIRPPVLEPVGLRGLPRRW